MKYAEYKDSSVDWIGKVPIHWNIMRGKFIVKVLPGYAFDSKKFTSDEGISLIRIRDINNTSTEMNYSGSFNEEYVVNTGDILVGMDGDFNVAKWKGERALLNQRVCKIVGTNIMLSSYMYYLLSRPLKLINDVCYATTVKHLSTSDIENSFFPVPTIQEQHAIVAYLNEKWNKIDGAIDVQKKKIDLLNELKQTIITNAVTKGLNPNAPMKDSGVEWIGEVPTHWEVMKTSLAFLGIGSGTTPSTSRKEYYTEEDGLYWLQTGDLNDGEITDTSKKITSLAADECNLKFYPTDSVVIAMYGATIGKVGLLKISTSTNQACCVLPKSKRCIPAFAFYLFIGAKKQLLIDAMGGGQPNISQDIIKKLKVSIPPISEQRIIVDHIAVEVSKIDAQISKANRRIELLNELKQSIITEAVTGKIKVI